MSKGPRIKPTVRQVIVGEALKDRKKPRRQLAVELQTIIDSMGEIAPAEETLEKLISQARNHESPLDKPWSLSKLIERAIPSDSVPVILAIQDYRRQKGKEPLTIREAYWLSRILPLIQRPKVLSTSRVLNFWAEHYAATERLAEITGTEINSSDSDRIIFNYPEEYAAYPFTFDGFLSRGNFELDEIGSGLKYVIKVRSLNIWLETLEGEQRAKHVETEKKLKGFVDSWDTLEKSCKEHAAYEAAFEILVAKKEITEDEVNRIYQAADELNSYYYEHPDDRNLPEKDQTVIVTKIVEKYKISDIT